MPLVDGIGLPDGRPRPDEDAFFWATDAPVSDPGRFAKPLAAAFARTGLWPLLWEWEEDPANYYGWRPEIRDAGASAGEAVLRALWSSVAEDSGSDAAFPGLAPASVARDRPPGLDNAFDVVGDDAQRASWQPSQRLLLVPCTRPADALAVLGWDYSEIPLSLITAVLRSWEERFGAVPVQLEPSALTLHIGAPPKRMEQAMHLAAELCAVAEGPFIPPSSLGGLAEMLLTGKATAPLEMPEMHASPTLWRFAVREYCPEALRELAP